MFYICISYNSYANILSMYLMQKQTYYSLAVIAWVCSPNTPLSFAPCRNWIFPSRPPASQSIPSKPSTVSYDLYFRIAGNISWGFSWSPFVSLHSIKLVVSASTKFERICRRWCVSGFSLGRTRSSNLINVIIIV